MEEEAEEDICIFVSESSSLRVALIQGDVALSNGPENVRKEYNKT